MKPADLLLAAAGVENEVCLQLYEGSIKALLTLY